MAKKSSTGACRFCGQSVIVEDGADMTAPQLEEAATMQCGCEKAMEYQESANRRTVAHQRVNELFGADAGEFKQPEALQAIMQNAVDAICDKKNEGGSHHGQDRAALPDRADGKRQDKNCP